MFPCPSCNTALRTVRAADGIAYGCPRCGGKSVAVPVLRRHSGTEFVRSLLKASREAAGPPGRGCPFCGRPMKTIRPDSHGGTLELDYCALCGQTWFDPHEFDYAPALPQPKEPQLAPELRQAIAEYKVKVIAEQAAEAEADTGPSPLQCIPAILGLPVEFNDHPMIRRPWVTWALAAIMAGLFALLLGRGALEQAANDWGFIPDQPFRHGGATWITSFLLHGGILHIAFNMYYFLVFADNVEDRLGRLWFLALLAAAHFVGVIVHAAGDPRGDIPVVGASAGISGVLGYYAVMFPHAKVGLLLKWVVWIRIRVVWALVFYVLMQILGAWQQSLGLSSVSAFAHLGGLAVGVFAALATRYLDWKPKPDNMRMGE